MGWGVKAPPLLRMASRKEISRWYDDWHKEHGIESWRPAYAYPSFLGFLGEKPEGKLLDVGCGTGFLLDAARKIGLETHGLDISSEAVKIAGETSPESQITVGTMEEIDGMFNYITALGSLEHCSDIKKAAKAIYDALVPGGRFVAMVPNSKFIGFEYGRKLSIQDEISETPMSLDEWTKLFEEAGFIIREVTYDDWPTTIAPLDRTYQFIFVMEKQQ